MNLSTPVQAHRSATKTKAAGTTGILAKGASIKTLLVHVQPPPAGEARLTATIALAKSLGAAVVGIGGSELPIVTDPAFGFVDGTVVQILYDQMKEDLARAERTFRSAAKDAGVDHTWRGGLDFPERLVAANARTADLLVATGCRGSEPANYADPGELLMSSGLPVLVLPPEAEGLNVRTVLIAWKDTRETRRAISDALPFLAAAKRVMVVAIPEFSGQDLEGELADVAERLRRLGISADCEVSPHLDISVGKQLLAIADSREADLIVAGGYGHSRLREWMFGGVTEHLLKSSHRPVLFSR